MLINIQERELEKVNAFYLQKEAEVGWLQNRIGRFLLTFTHSSRFVWKLCWTRKRSYNRETKARTDGPPNSRLSKKDSNSLVTTSTNSNSSSKSMAQLSPKSSRNGTKRQSRKLKSYICLELLRSSLSSTQLSLVNFLIKQRQVYKN